jgi:GT2 family glycosyltransferase
MEVKVAFLIVNWNGRDDLEKCLESIASFMSAVRHTVVIADNASTDGSWEMVERKFPEVNLLRNPQNFGFAKANNSALKHLDKLLLRPDYVIFLNNDARLIDSSLAVLIRFLDQDMRITGAIPAVLLKDSSLQVGIGGFELSLTSAFCYSFFLARLFPQAFRGLFFDQNHFYRRNVCCRLDWLSGVCLVVRKAALDRTDGFPEVYFLYAEDLALCRRLRKNGSLVYFPRARVLHLKHSRQRSDWNTAWLDSLFQYYLGNEKRRPRLLKLILLKLIFLAGFLIRAGGYALMSPAAPEKFGPKRRELFHYAKHVLAVLAVGE